MPSEANTKEGRELIVTEEVYHELAKRAAAQGVSIADYMAALVHTTKTTRHTRMSSET